MKEDILKNVRSTISIKGKIRPILTRVFLIISALFLASVFLGVSGYSWNGILLGLWRGVAVDFGGTIKAVIPLLMTALAVCIPARMGLFNLGVDGQLYMGALFCTIVGLRFPKLPTVAGIPMLLIVGGIAGMLFALIPALLKIELGADEVVSTLLLNFVAELITEAIILGPLKTDGLVNSSEYLSENYFLSPVMEKANSGLYIAIVLAIILAIVMNKTKFGYELKVTGINPKFARYGGIKEKSTMLKSMMISGFIAGLTGTIMILGVHHRFVNLFNSDGVGFDGIAVGILAGYNPIGSIFSSVFFGTLTNGMTNMQRVTEIPSATSDIVEAIVIIVISATIAIPKLREIHLFKKREKLVRRAI